MDPDVTPGDFNDDGLIDLVDFNILASNFNERVESFAEGDMDFNRRVDLADFLEFRKVFNASQGAAASVPEPSSLMLFITAGLFIACRRRMGNVRVVHG